MYFSRGKRRMLLRITAAAAIVFTSLYLLYNLPWAQQLACASASVRSLTSLCVSEFARDWNLFYHLGGNGPWIPRSPEGLDKLPRKCAVDQIHMISRHAERYPTRNAGARHLDLLERLRAPGVKLSGSLGFLDTWEYFTNISDPSFEALTDSGPYAGTLQSYNTGKKLRERYDSLVRPNKTTAFWSCGADRNVETARYFANGFFGKRWNESGVAKLVIIPETAERGGDTLTPGDTCLNYIDDKVDGHDKGYAEFGKWQETFTGPIGERLHQDAGGLAFNPLEIYSMMEMCGFEVLARGSSPWCEVFTREEWLDFEYGRDLLHFYRAGPGNDFSGAMGWLWLNATTTLLVNESATGAYFSFVHDGDIVPLITTLGLLDQSKGLAFLPNDKRLPSRKWKTSDVTPMGGRLVFERVSCSAAGLGQNLRRSYVRLFINDGIVDLEKSMIGSGLPNGIGMKQWLDLVRRRGHRFGSFKEICGLPKHAPDGISFLRPH